MFTFSKNTPVASVKGSPRFNPPLPNIFKTTRPKRYKFGFGDMVKSQIN